MNRLHNIPGPHYREVVLPAVAGDTATGLIASLTNPFDGNAYLDAVEFIPIAAIAGNNTNTQNLNVQLADGTEIANLDFPTGISAAKGTTQAFTMTGTAAQRTFAAGASVYIVREDVGTSPALVTGHVVRATWKAV